MTKFHTVKPIDNSRLVRPVAPNRGRELARDVAMGVLLAGFTLVYAWQHFACIQLRYELEGFKSELAQKSEINQELKLEVAGLRAPSRIDEIARNQLGLTVPVVGQVEPVENPNETVFAELHATQPTRQQ